MNLHLLKDARSKHMFLHHEAPPRAITTNIHDPIRRSSPLTLLADPLLLNAKLMFFARVKISQRHRNADFHVGTFALAAAAKVPASAEEARE